MFTTNILVRHNQNQTIRHWNGVKHLLRYLKGTSDLGLYYQRSHRHKMRGFVDSGFNGPERGKIGNCIHFPQMRSPDILEIHEANGNGDLNQPCGVVGLSWNGAGMCLVENNGTNHKPTVPNLGGGDETNCNIWRQCCLYQTNVFRIHKG